MPKPNQSAPLKERLYRKVKALPNGCLEWIGYRQKSGYGVIGVGSRTDGSRRVVLVHRLAWELENGTIPNELMVCHRCDNPACVSLDHLFLGTQTDNMHDMIRKGRKRVVRGYSHASQKISHADAQAIKAEYAAGGITQWQLATRYGVAQGQISLIILDKHWTSH